MNIPQRLPNLSVKGPAIHGLTSPPIVSIIINICFQLRKVGLWLKYDGQTEKIIPVADPTTPALNRS